MGFKVIISERQTEIVAKRRAIEEAMRFWDENEKEYFVEFKIKYNKTTTGGRYNPVEEQIVARREIISQYLKVEALQYWRKDENNSLRLHKAEYLELWDYLVKHKYKGGNSWERFTNFMQKKLQRNG